METSTVAQAVYCPHCGDTILNPQYFCPHCARRIRDTVSCESCREPIHAQAKKCPHCNTANAALLAAQAGQLQITVTASPFGAFFSTWNFTSLFRPPVIEVSGGKINTTVWTFFTLRVHKSEIEMSRLASVRYTKGVIWSSLVFETFGGAAEDMGQHGLRHNDAINVAARIKEVIGR
jgi:hypothetical protein